MSSLYSDLSEFGEIILMCGSLSFRTAQPLMSPVTLKTCTCLQLLEIFLTIKKFYPVLYSLNAGITGHMLNSELIFSFVFFLHVLCLPFCSIVWNIALALL